MKGWGRAFWRLLSVQGAWNFERMLGVGLGYAAEPLLKELEATDGARHADATVRSVEFFNSHPYLAGVALGALVRAEYEQVPGPQISRLRAALCAPLGALGDQLFWAGVVPALMGAGLVAVALGGGVTIVLALVVAYNILRLATSAWALRVGLAGGMRVAATMSASSLQRMIPVAGYLAAVMVGAGLPLIGAALLDPLPAGRVLLGSGVLVVALTLRWLGGPRFTILRQAIVGLVLAATFSSILP